MVVTISHQGYVKRMPLSTYDTSVLVFETRIGDVSVHGADFIHTDDAGLISELTVMVRPLSAAHALADAMGAQFDQIQAEASRPWRRETSDRRTPTCSRRSTSATRRCATA